MMSPVLALLLVGCAQQAPKPYIPDPYKQEDQAPIQFEPPMVQLVSTDAGSHVEMSLQDFQKWMHTNSLITAYIKEARLRQSQIITYYESFLSPMRKKD